MLRPLNPERTALLAQWQCRLHFHAALPAVLQMQTHLLLLAWTLIDHYAQQAESAWRARFPQLALPDGAGGMGRWRMPAGAGIKEMLRMGHLHQDLPQRLDQGAMLLQAANPELRGLFIDWRFNHAGLPPQDLHKMYAGWLNEMQNHLGEARTSQVAAAALLHGLLRKYLATGMVNRLYCPSPPMLGPLLAALLEVEPNERVFDPCCGFAELLLSVVDNVQARHGAAPIVIGQELDLCNVRMAHLLKLFYGWRGKIYAGDVLLAPRHQRIAQPLTTMDVVVCDAPLHSAAPTWPDGLPPPFVRALGDVLHEVDMQNCEASARPWLFGLHGLASLKPGGRVALVLPEHCLIGPGLSARIRRSLLKQNWIEGVIRLPSWLWPQADAPRRYVVHCRRDRNNTPVSLFDASACMPHNSDILVEMARYYGIRRAIPGISRLINPSDALNDPLAKLHVSSGNSNR